MNTVLLVPSPTVAGINLVGGGGYLMGFALRETTGAATAKVALVDGQVDASPFLSVVALAAGESTRDYLTGLYVPFQSGVRLVVTAGSVEGAVYVLLGDQIEDWHAMNRPST